MEDPRISLGSVGPEANYSVCPHSQHVYKDTIRFMWISRAVLNWRWMYHQRKYLRNRCGSRKGGHPVQPQDGSVESCDLRAVDFPSSVSPPSQQWSPDGSCIILRACSLQQHTRGLLSQCRHPDWPKPPEWLKETFLSCTENSRTSGDILATVPSKNLLINEPSRFVIKSDR